MSVENERAIADDITKGGYAELRAGRWPCLNCEYRPEWLRDGERCRKCTWTLDNYDRFEAVSKEA